MTIRAKTSRLHILLITTVLSMVTIPLMAQSIFLYNREEIPTVLEIIERIPGDISASDSPGEKSDRSSLENVIRDSVRLSLERAGLKVIIRSGRVIREGVAIASLITRFDVDYLLIVSYSNSSGNVVKIDYKWYRKDDAEKPVRYSDELVIGLNLDNKIGKNVKKLLGKIVEVTRKSTFRIDSIDYEREKAGTKNLEVTLKTSELPLPAAIYAKKPGKQNKREKKDISTEETSERKSRHFELALGTGTFLPLGEARNYFNFALKPILAVNYLFRLPWGTIDTGITGGLDYFFAIGSTGFASNFIADLGLKIGYTSGEIPGLPIGFNVSLSGGPASFIMLLNNSSILTKAMAFGSGGLTLVFRFSDYAGIKLGGSYIILFDQVDMLMGISPSFNLYLRL